MRVKLEEKDRTRGNIPKFVTIKKLFLSHEIPESDAKKRINNRTFKLGVKYQFKYHLNVQNVYVLYVKYHFSLTHKNVIHLISQSGVHIFMVLKRGRNIFKTNNCFVMSLVANGN